jgi:nitroreductase
MDVLEAIRTRRSVRSYSGRTIAPDAMDRMKQALRMAPSACNIQPWHFVLVSDAALREKLGAAARNQTWLAQAPVIVVACGLPGRAYKGMGGYGNSIDIDLAIAMDHLTLAAVAEALGTCWIGAFDEAQVKVLLGIPAHAKVVAMTPLGYPATPDLIKPLDESRRKPTAELFSENRYNGPTE